MKKNAPITISHIRFAAIAFAFLAGRAKENERGKPTILQMDFAADVMTGGNKPNTLAAMKAIIANIDDKTTRGDRARTGIICETAAFNAANAPSIEIATT